MRILKLKVEVEVWDIKVTEDLPRRGYYTFCCSIRVNGGKKKYGEVDGSWSSQTKQQFRRVLGRGYASHLALEKYFS